MPFSTDTDPTARIEADPRERLHTVSRALARANLEFAAAVAAGTPAPVLEQLVSNVARLQLQEDDARSALRRRDRGLLAAVRAAVPTHPA